MQNSLVNLVLITAIIHTSMACISLGDRNRTTQNSSIKSPIVQQTNGNEVMTRIDRKRWVQLRQATNSQEIKLYATLGAKEWDVAVKEARHYLSSHPKNQTALSVLAIGLAMQKNYSLAAYYGGLLNQYYPGYPEAKNLLGLATLNRPGASFSDYKKALSYFEQAFDSDGNQIASGLNLGHLYLQMGNAKAAVDVFGAVRERCKDCSESLLGYAIASSRVRDFNAAKTAFKEILDQDPNHPGALYYLALIENYGNKRPDKAIELLTTLVKDTKQRDLDIKRKGNVLLRRLQASEYARKEKKQSLPQSLEDNGGLMPVNDAP